MRQPIRRFRAQIHRQQRRVARQIFGKQFQQRFLDITAAERHSLITGIVAMRPVRQRHALLEQRDAGFLPQRLAEQQRRIGRNRHHRRGDQQRGVEKSRRLGRHHLQMSLKRGGGRF